MKKTKAKRKTLKQIRQEFEDRYRNHGHEVEQLNGQCGMRIISNLWGDKTDQIYALLFGFFAGTDNSEDPKVASQVLISDTITSTDWAESKKHASFKGPITVNPNSGNKIRVWIFKVTDIVKIYNSK